MVENENPQWQKKKEIKSDSIYLASIVSNHPVYRCTIRIFKIWVFITKCCVICGVNINIAYELIWIEWNTRRYCYVFNAWWKCNKQKKESNWCICMYILLLTMDEIWRWWFMNISTFDKYNIKKIKLENKMNCREKSTIYVYTIGTKTNNFIWYLLRTYKMLNVYVVHINTSITYEADFAQLNLRLELFAQN